MFNLLILFPVDIAEKNITDNLEISIDNFTIGYLKKLIWRNKQDSFEKVEPRYGRLKISAKKMRSGEYLKRSLILKLTVNKNSEVRIRSQLRKFREVFLDNLQMIASISFVQLTAITGSSLLWQNINGQLTKYHLVSSSEYSKHRVIRVSMLWGSAVEVNCSWETFGELWKRIIGISWIECRDISTNVSWKTVKRCLQEMPNIYIILFGPTDIMVPNLQDFRLF
ncbi:11486_t:CDS:2 [Ambispora gerdemannii]|uniref:11486_t:CDS:1 n=1 Tax=Ambispora gerdemannii TaxID=144530 RepID=A0A9N8W2I3_9GLOM|nr:11486_t:CDS:2 [Ambispora gerdemannii]